MYKSIVDFLEIGKDKTAHWLIRCQNVFKGIFLFAGGSLLLVFSVPLFLMENTGGSIIFGVLGLAGVSFYLISRKKGKYAACSSLVICIGMALTMLALLFTGDFLAAGFLCVIFPMAACILFHTSRGTLISLIVLAAYFACGLLLHAQHTFAENPQTLHSLTAFFLVGLVIMIVVSVFLVFTEEIEHDSDHKISDIQKEAEIKNELMSQLSHQINTPLNNIVVMGNLLNETNLNHRQKDWMETILASANNLTNVVNFIASRITATGMVNTKPINIAFNLQTVLNNSIQIFVGQSEEYNIGLKPSMDPPYILEGDPIQIRQIFLTLIDSIIKNKKAEKINIIIAFRVRQETEQLFDVTFEIRVSDQLDFYLSDDINYSMASKMITASGNKLNVSQDQNFTTFTFTLSYKKAQTDLAEKPSKSSESVETDISSHESSKVDLKEAKILLTEDNLINQKIVILSIQKLVKSIDVANNGQEAVNKFNEGKYDIILMDIQMPVMDGILATKKIRETEGEKRLVPTPIIAITANALAGDREHCLASGMDEYISKPFQVEVLVSKMKNLLAVGSSIRRL